MNRYGAPAGRRSRVMRRGVSSSRFAFLPASFLFLLVPVMAGAQSPASVLHESGDPATESRAAQAEGFLFRAPLVNIVLRGGFNIARAGSDVFDVAREQLTLETSDFSAFVIGVDMGVQVRDRIDIVAGFAHMSTSKPSSYSDYEDEDGLPITQRTRFAQTPLTLGARYYLTSRGRQIGRFVWIPATVSPYIGAAGGVMRWEFVQTGSWVDFRDLAIFEDDFEAEGWTGIGQAIAGFDYSLGTRVMLNTEARYTFGSDEMGRDFDVDPIDLSGFQLTMGLKFRF